MKTYDHTKEVLQQAVINCDEISFIEQDEENSNYNVVLRPNDFHGEELHIYRSSCVLLFERNFHSMLLRIG
jgi:hypothetical protein